MADRQKQEAKAFVDYWKDKGYEKGQSQPFWLSLLRSVYGVGEPEQFIEFEDAVHLDNTSFIDGMIPSTKVMIEQKGRGKDLNKAIRQSDGSLLTPFQQAKRYITELPLSQHPRWVVTCNFEEFYVYDMERPGGDPEVILLENLPEEYYREIANSVGCSKSTVGEVISRCKECGLTYDDAASLPPERLNELIYPDSFGRKQVKDEPDWEAIHRCLHSSRRINLQYIWQEEYRKENPDGYSYSRFCAKYDSWKSLAVKSSSCPVSAGPARNFLSTGWAIPSPVSWIMTRARSMRLTFLSRRWATAPIRSSRRSQMRRR